MRLVDFNRGLLSLIFQRLGYPTQVVQASELALDSRTRGSEALAEIVARVGASSYLSEPGGSNYLDERPFLERGLRVLWQEFRSPVYDQPWGEFRPNLSVLDALFNVGFDGLRRLLGPVPA